MNSAELSVIDLLDAMRRLGRQVSFYPSLAKLVGIKEAIFLQQLVYWTPKARNERGWIYKSAEDLEEETSLTYREQQRVRTTLRRRGLIEERYSRNEHRLYFRVVREAVKRLTSEAEAPDKSSDAHPTNRRVPPDETSGGTSPFVSSHKEQEKTQESTSREVAARVDRAKIQRVQPPDCLENRVRPTTVFNEAKKNHRPAPAWVKGDLAEDLYRGIHHKKIANTFFDARLLSPREQLAECVRVAVTSLVTARVARLKVLSADEIESRAFEVLLPSLATLELVGNFDVRRHQTVQAVTRAVIDVCVRMLKEHGSGQLK